MSMENTAMLDTAKTSDLLKQRLAAAFDAWTPPEGVKKQKNALAGLIAQASGMPCTPQTVNNWFKNGTMDKKWLPYVSQILNIDLITGESQAGSGPNAAHTYKPVMEAGQPGVDAYEIAYWDARGSCGGGSHNEGAILKGYLAKEPSWFVKYDVKPHDAIAISADGDSMSDFIVDGDIVIFNRAKTTPRSGSIFLIAHPDGLKIKQLRREIDGTWVLESRNSNKQRFPDERIPHESTDLLVVKGEFVYRQGG